MSQAHTLSDLAGESLAFACSRCDWRARVAIAALVRRYGADYGLPDLRRDACRHCARAKAELYERCDIYFPDLVDGD